jgi:hypothetical protein
MSMSVAVESLEAHLEALIKLLYLAKDETPPEHELHSLAVECLELIEQRSDRTLYLTTCHQIQLKRAENRAERKEKRAVEVNFE